MMRHDQPEGLSIPHNSRMCLVTTLCASSFREKIIFGPRKVTFFIFQVCWILYVPGPRFRFQGFETRLF
jgi:hypothetical protein